MGQEHGIIFFFLHFFRFFKEENMHREIIPFRMSSLLLLAVVVAWAGASENHATPAPVSNKGEDNSKAEDVKRDASHTNLRVSKHVHTPPPPVSKKQLPESRLPRYNHGGRQRKGAYLRPDSLPGNYNTTSLLATAATPTRIPAPRTIVPRGLAGETR